MKRRISENSKPLLNLVPAKIDVIDLDAEDIVLFLVDLIINS